uniref:Uncharacterized protein n=1 Tax=Anguilla anguilla TaxID=7936 RepID=A0A0E9TFL4_ANGAN
MLCCVVLFAKACHKDALQRAEENGAGTRPGLPKSKQARLNS